MSATDQATEPVNAATAGGAKPTHRAVSDPREVATIVMARMNQVNAKKDELAIAIHALLDVTQQLTRTYAEQSLAIEQLRRRVKALEAMAAGQAATPPSTVQ
jgi:hypothetical protein